MSNIQKYNETPALNYSGAKVILKSPLAYKSWLEQEQEDTPALRIGRLVHLASLQPDECAKNVIVAPECDRRTKSGREIWENFMSTLKEGQMAITKDEADLVANISNSARDGIDRIKKMIGAKTYRAEEPLFGELNGIKIKGRPDLIMDDVVVDVKTTLDATAKSFGRDISNFKYHLQAAWYLHLTGGKRFLFIAVEKAIPFDYAIYELDEQSLEVGKKLMEKACELYGQCNLYKSFPGYTKEVQTLTLPKWDLTETL
jgi:exodeoxyribonuclease VIII